MKSEIQSIATAMILVSGVFPVSEAAEVEITSITPARDGAKVEWQNTEEGYAYTLQERRSLTSGNWQNVRTRYRWPDVKTDWTVLGLTNAGSSPRFFRVLAEAISIPERGKLESSLNIRLFTTNNVRSVLSADGAPLTGVRWPVRYCKITYETMDPHGLPITATGGLFVPEAVTDPVPLLSYQHGSEIYKPWVPSQNDSFWFSRGLLFASSGYLTLMPDYLGLGDSPGLHPWLHAKTEATAVVDMLRAVKIFCADNSIVLNSQLFLAGFSQGGHATAAAHREIEAFHADEFTVTASAPMCGPYDMVLSLNNLLTKPTYSRPGLIFFVLAAWLPIYDLADTVEELLAPPFDRNVAPMLDGNSNFLPMVGRGALISNAQAALARDFREAILTNPDHPLWLAAADNTVLDWVPQAPMRLYHCAADDVVPLENSTRAQDSFTANGSCCVTVIDPSPRADHNNCFWPSIVSAKEWFDSFE